MFSIVFQFHVLNFSGFIMPLQARVYEGREPIQFLSIFQSFIVYKVGIYQQTFDVW